MIPLAEVGKAPDNVSLFRGHKGPVLDTAFDPFDSQIIASCSDDGNIFIWRIPDNYSFHKYRNEDDEVIDIEEPIKILKGHTRKVGHVAFHPCAKDVLVSSSIDYSVKFWNVQTGEAEFNLQHPDLVTSFAFNYNGQLLATTSRDKKIRIWDLSSRKMISEGQGHTGAKPSRVVWLGQSDRILTTGFSRLSDRQVGIWDVNDIEKGPIDGFFVIDSSSGVLIPIFDESNSILYLAGKGDGNIRYYEFGNDNLFELSQYSSTDAQRGFAASPKMFVNTKENEILKSFKTINDNTIEPISFIVPRKSEMFQEDIYPDAPSDIPALSASEWFSGKVASGPELIDLRLLYENATPAKAISVKPQTFVSEKESAASTPKVTPAASQSVKSNIAQTPKPEKTLDKALKNSSEIDSLLARVDKEEPQHDVGDAKDEDEWSVPKTTRFEFSSEKLENKEHVIEKPGPVKTETLYPDAMKADTPNRDTEIVQSEIMKPEPPVQYEITKLNEAKMKDIEPDSVQKPTSSTKKTAGAGTQSMTLRETVDRLASLVLNLESQIARLTNLNDEREQRIKNLEEKIRISDKH